MKDLDEFMAISFKLKIIFVALETIRPPEKQELLDYFQAMTGMSVIRCPVNKS